MKGEWQRPQSHCTQVSNQPAKTNLITVSLQEADCKKQAQDDSLVDTDSQLPAKRQWRDTQEQVCRNVD